MSNVILHHVIMNFVNNISWIEITLISKELDLVMKYHILKPASLRGSVGKALRKHSKGRRFDSHRGQAYFSACLVRISLRKTPQVATSIIFTWDQLFEADLALTLV